MDATITIKLRDVDGIHCGGCQFCRRFTTWHGCGFRFGKPGDGYTVLKMKDRKPLRLDECLAAQAVTGTTTAG